MNRTVLLAALLSLPLLASAQAIRCTDPATGKTLYTDQPCQGGQLVVPPRTAEEQRRDAALACGQPPPADIVVVQPYAPVAPYPRPPHRYPRPGHGEYSPGWGGGPFGMPRPTPRPRYEPGTEPIPAQVRPPSAR